MADDAMPLGAGGDDVVYGRGREVYAAGMLNLAAVIASLWALTLGACGGEEEPATGLHLDVQAQTELDTIQWRVIPDDPAHSVVVGGPEAVGLSPSELRDMPFEVRVDVDRGAHVVQLLGTSAAGDVLGTVRCYAVEDVVQDEVLLVELTTLDQDGDGFPADPMATCLTPSGLPCSGGRCTGEAGADCDPADPEIHPGATETCGDGIDQDCDGEDLPCS